MVIIKCCVEQQSVYVCRPNATYDEAVRAATPAAMYDVLKL